MKRIQHYFSGLFAGMLIASASCSSSKSAIERIPSTLMADTVPAYILSRASQMGLDSRPALNNAESDFLDFYFRDRRGNFSFAGKKLVLLTGSLGKSVYPKDAYFMDIRKCIAKGIMPSSQFQSMIIIPEDMVSKIDCDVVILLAVKKNPTLDEVLKSIKRMKSKEQYKEENYYETNNH